MAHKQKSNKMVRKGALSQKICVQCEKPFAWRKKWARDWEEVKYCSERCRRQKPDKTAPI